MKKVFLSLTALLLMACATPTVNQTELYGEVEEVITLNGHYRVKVWCKTKEKYYKIITDKSYQKGEVIRIK
jgi:hypothetical protein